LFFAGAGVPLQNPVQAGTLSRIIRIARW